MVSVAYLCVKYYLYYNLKYFIEKRIQICRKIVRLKKLKKVMTYLKTFLTIFVEYFAYCPTPSGLNSFPILDEHARDPRKHLSKIHFH